MANMELTANDRKFLRQLHIDPESTPVEDVQDILQGPLKYRPTYILISHTMSREIIKEFGVLTLDTYWAYRKLRG